MLAPVSGEAAQHAAVTGIRCRSKAAEPTETKAYPALAALDEVLPDELSRRQALERLYELKRLRREQA